MFAAETTELLPPPPGPAAPAPPASRLKALTQPLVFAGAGLVGATFLYFNDPSAASNPYPRCPLKYLTGIDCPGCGLSRGLHSLLHGDIAGMVSHNLLLVFVIPWLVLAFARWTASRLGYTIPKLVEPKPWMVPAVVVFLVVFTVVRNIPVGPFRWLDAA